MSKEEIEYGYYSKVLNKPYNTLEELKEAEEEYKREQEKKLIAIEEKKALANEIEELYKEYINAIELGNKEISEVQTKVRKSVADAKNTYIEKKNDFIDKYGSYHMTYNNKEAKVKDDNEEVTTEDIFDIFFDAFRQFPWFK